MSSENIFYKIICISLILIFLILTPIIEFSISNANWRIFFSISSILFILFSYLYYRRNSESAMHFVFISSFSIFHFGLLYIWAFNEATLDTVGMNIQYWFFDTTLANRAYLAATLFVVGCVSALGLPLSRISTTYTRDRDNLIRYQISLFLLILFVGIWFFIVLNSGFSAYDVLLAGLSRGGLTAYIGFVHAALGVSFLITVILSSGSRLPIYIFSGWVIVAFPLGLRGEVAFPALISLGILACRGLITIRLWMVMVASLGFLLLSSAIFVIRISTNDASFVEAASAIRGLAELGGSIRPSFEVMRWLETGDTFRYGATYWAPFDRTLLRIFPYGERLPGLEDERLMNVLIAKRAGPYGFSISAEAFINFGYVGCALVGLGVGYVLRILGRSFAQGGYRPLAVVICFALFVHIRQAFITTYGGFISGVTIVLLIWWGVIVLRQWRQGG